MIKFSEDFGEDDLLFPITYDRLYQIWNFWKPSKEVKGINVLKTSGAMLKCMNPNYTFDKLCSEMGISPRNAYVYFENAKNNYF